MHFLVHMTFLSLLPLDQLQQLHVFVVLWAPELDAVLHMGPPRNRAEGGQFPPLTHCPPSFDAAQDTFPVLFFFFFFFFLTIIIYIFNCYLTPLLVLLKHATDLLTVGTFLVIQT